MNANSTVVAGNPAGLTDSQWDAICALPPHDPNAKATDEGSRSTAVYLSEARYLAERRDLFDKVPVPVAVSALLPQPNMAVAQDGYGLPLLLTRDKAGVARVFVNACRHRGSKLVEGCNPAKANMLVCPYHAWSYALDGRLVGIPRHDTFPSLSKENLGLIPLATSESGGFIWAGLDHKLAPQPLDSTDQIAADMEAFGLQKMFVYGRRTYDLAANWKLVIEPFLEGYHVQRLHANSIGAMFADVPNVYSRMGHHIRQTSGKANFDPGLLMGKIDNLHKYITHAYLIFPNTIIVTSPYYISVMILMPRAKDRTVVDYYMMVKAPPDNPKGEEIYKRSYELIHAVFGGEDFRAAQLQQSALNSGAIEQIYFGGLENMCPPFHASVESFLAAP
jgi:phenylpropionate dioxygenase-like ring-hydroxylating dioxygenase large terminal subunit